MTPVIETLLGTPISNPAVHNDRSASATVRILLSQPQLITYLPPDTSPEFNPFPLLKLPNLFMGRQDLGKDSPSLRPSQTLLSDLFMCKLPEGRVRRGQAEGPLLGGRAAS